MIFEFLTRDVAVGGGLTSPLLSWLGAAGLLLFFGWQVGRLVVGVSRASAPFDEVRPLLTVLATEAEASDLRHACDRAFSSDRVAPPGGKSSATGATDLARLAQLDQTMREADAFRRPWVQFRKTLLIERVSWAAEPRIFSTRQAEEFFTQERVLGGSIDLVSCGQVPSLITGFGLLLTFVAICIGLGRLHVDGQAIDGISGLVNGLAGKFLTSIVGLVCANAFVLLERPILRRLQARHAEFLTLLDESFPRRTVEDLLDALSQQRTAGPVVTPPASIDPVRGQAQEELATPIAELAAAVRALSEQMQEPRNVWRTPDPSVQGVEGGRSRRAPAAVGERERAHPAATRHRGDGLRQMGPRVG